MAVGVIPNVGHLDLPSMSQQQIDAQAVDVELLALVILTNHVRHDSKATVSELQERYSFCLLLAPLQLACTLQLLDQS